MDIFDMASGLAKLELTDLFVSTAKSAMEDLDKVQLSDEEKQRLKMLISLASAGAIFKV